MPLDGYSSTSIPARPLRIALFSGNYNYTVDGANKTLNRLVGHLEQVEGHQVRVYSPTAPVPAFPATGDLVSVPSVTIPTRPDYRIALGLPAVIRRDVEAFAPDLVHLSAPDLLGMEALKLARRMGVPAVASLHTLFDSYLDYYALGCLKPILKRRLQRFYSDCDYVLAPTRALAEQLEAAGLEGQTRIWARGVDGDLFSPARRDPAWRRAHGFDDAQPVIVFFGRLVMEKGLAVFVEAVRRLELSGGAVSVLVIGDGPARSWFEEALPDAVFTGFLQGEALARAIAGGDIFLNPSATETFGNVNLEAMASGLALVCADVPNSRALIRHDRTGILCDARDAGAYAGAIRALIDQPAERMRLARAALVESTLYRWPEMLGSVARVYREALASHQPALRVRGREYALMAG
ncbi:MAG TPA: glycosyltransferase family 1 protein [Caulobacteraceae bacterium]|jgi:glycosyltransferase involved in cell wall biosynthesis|nr:glycosyltransferase family 1 protein [Caulobacteraceae bacterium]